MKDMVKKGRHVRPLNAGKPRTLTDEQVRDIRQSSLSGRALARMHNTSKTTVDRIKHGKLYKDVT
jgi:DNA-binding transcriptional regulator YiaG